MKTHHLLILTLIFILTACLPQTKETPTTLAAAQAPTPTPLTSTDPPILQIDSGGHLALIGDIAFTPDGRYLVSASDDKLIRVWDLETGKTVRTLRGQIGAGLEGKIYAMALSPNGRWLAAGGYFGKKTGSEGCVSLECGQIRLYNFANGELVTLLKGHTRVVFSLAFSPDNRYLVSGSPDKNAIIWNLESKPLGLDGSIGGLESKPLGLDISKAKALDSKKLSGHTDHIYAVAFTPDSQRVVTGSDDHSLRLWRVRDGGLISTLKGHTDKVYAVAISPQEDIIASGSYDYTIRLWDGRTGQFIKTLANQGTMVGSLSFSPDGRYLVSSCGYGGCASNPEHVWSIPNGKEIVTYKGHDNNVLATAVSPDGRIVATGGGDNQEIHLWSLRDGKLQQRLSGVGAATWAVGFSSDGRELGWGKTWKRSSRTNHGPIEYTITFPSKAKALDSTLSKASALDTSLGTPRKLSGSDKRFSRAQDKWRNWTLRHRAGGNYGDKDAILDIRQKNRTVASIERGATDGYGHSSYTFTPDGKRIISGGGNGFLTAYNRDGNKLGDYVGHTSDVWAVAVSPDGRLLASGSGDQTVRLWNVESRENLLTLFHGSDGEWVAWTPTGHYTASPNGDKMVGWQINRGVDKAADYVKAAQLRDHLYRPDVIDATIRLRSVKKAIAQTGAHFDLARLQRELPPRFQIASPRRGSKIEKGIASVVLNIAENTLAIQKFEVYINGRQVTPQKVRNINPIINRHQRSLEVPLENGENRMTIRATNRLGSTSAEVTVFYDGESQIREGTLHLVSIGVSAYPHLSEQEQLDFAAIDAQAIYNKLIATAPKQYRDINSVLISDTQGKTPTKSNIETALQALTHAKTEDTTLLFLAGHGINLDDEYFFMPKGAKRQGSELDKNSLVRWKILQDAIANSQGRRILLVDTCHAGNAVNPRLLNDAANKNIFVLSATDANTVSRETNQFGHGVFTYALLEGLKGEADMMKMDGGKIMFSELNAYVTNMVKYLTKNRQIPVSQASSEGFVDFTFVQL